MNIFIRFFFTILPIFFFTIIGFAQPTLLISDATVPSGSTTTVDISVMDFTDITKTQFSINWNPAELTFIAVSDINMTNALNLTSANIDANDAANGNLVFSWSDPNDIGVTVDDGMNFFSIEFRALVPAGDSTAVNFSETPSEIVINRNASGDTNIFDPNFVQNSTIKTNAPIPDLFINLVPQNENTIFCRGDQICYDLQVVGFDSILSMQFALKWQGSVLEFDRVENFGLTDFNENTFNVNSDPNTGFVDSTARALLQPSSVEGLTNGLSLSDNTSLVTVCFNIIGDPNTETLIEITGDNITPEEVVNVNGVTHEIIPQNQSVQVSDCENLIAFSANCTNVVKDDTVCIDITTFNFKDINEAKFNLTWDNQILEFINTANHNLSNLTAANFTNTANSLTFNWQDPNNDGETITNDDVLFSACFKVIGNIDDIGNLIFNTDPTSHQFTKTNGDNLSEVRLNNCESLTVLAPKVKLSASHLESPPNEMICIPVTVDNFYNINHIEMPITWDPNILEYTGLQNYNLGGLGITNFDVSAVTNGQLQITSWDSPSLAGVTLNDATNIFEICFNVIGNIDDVSPIQFPNTDANPVFIKNAKEQEPGVEITGGSVTVVSSGLILSSTPLEIKQEDAICIDITTRNFNNLATMEYAHIWNSAVLRFDSITNVNAVLNQNDIVNNADGSIRVSWTSLNGASVADGTNLYTLCFTAIGELGDCANFTLDANPEVTTIESVGQDIGIFNNLGDICIDNFGLKNVITLAPTCNNDDGLIRLDISGDNGNTYVYQISKDGQEFINNADTKDSIRLENLTEGEYCLSVLDINSAKNLNQCFDIKIEDIEVPRPMAGPDIDLGCRDLTNLAVEIDGDVALGGGGIINYTWTALNGGIVQEGTENKEDAIVNATGTYILTVEINNCEASDTMEVFASTVPEIMVQPVGKLGCTQSTAQLNAEGSQIGMNQIGFWTTDIGHFVSDSTSLTPTVDKEGTYTFQIIDTLNGCNSSADVLVQIDTFKPKAVAGIDRQLGCEDEFITLSGQSSSTGSGISYEWSTPDGSSIVNFDKIEADVSRVGTYVLSVTNTINGCTATDTMMVIADESLPVARADKEAIIGCGIDEITLDGSASSQGRSFAYRWEDPTNQFLSDTTSIITQQAGLYKLIVTNIDNDDCIADTALVNVIIDKAPPQSSITQRLVLDCKSECKDLTANVPDGDHFKYQWITNEGQICEGENTPTAKVSAVALYSFIITNTKNNCIDTVSTIVSGDGTVLIADPGPTRTIGCKAEPVLLDGRGSTLNDNIDIQWKDEAGTVISTEATAEVMNAGTYTLTLEDKVLGCNASSKVEVTLNTDPPLANAGEDISLDGCEFPNNLRLNGSLSDSGPSITYAWSAPGGGKLLGDTSSMSPEIDGPGIYELTVTNSITGCSSTDMVQVKSNLEIPSANAGDDKTINCDEPTVTLAGFNETPENSTIRWSTDDGNILGNTDQLSLMVDAAGTYTLAITSQDGCTATDEVIVTSNVEMPAADAGDALSISCNQSTLLNGSGSTGDNFEISWTTSNGNILSGSNTFTPEVNLGGLYTLSVKNTSNNCVSTANVVITSDEALPLANAGDNQEICGQETALNATQIAGNVTGIWTTLEKSFITIENDPKSNVADLAPGNNTFIWTLSTENCPNYSADTMIVTVPNAPTAVEDAFEIEAGQSMVDLDLISNDQINFENYQVSIIQQPNTGELTDKGSGVYTFSTPARYYGTQEFQYEVCSATCADLCDLTSVRVVVLPGADVDTTNSLPNAITPNGDGLNDMLQFDELIFDASNFPTSELVIFNRWGDIVYKVSPYNNDWNGKATNGDALPEGTYYFVLRLDTAEGDIMKGDVTILR